MSTRSNRRQVLSVDLAPMLQASRVIAATIVRSLTAAEPHVSVAQLRILVMVGAHGPLTVGAVAEALAVNASNASRSCDRLVNDGLLDRRAAARDRRQVALTLTAAGADLVDRLMERRRADLAAVVGRMTPAEQRALVTALEPFNRAAEGVDALAAVGDEHLIGWQA